MQNQRYDQDNPQRPRQAPATSPPGSTPPSPRGSANGKRGTGSNKPEKGKRKTSNAHIASALVRAAATVVGCVFLAIFILRSASDLFGLNQIDKTSDIVIPINSDIKDVTKILADEGVVEQKLTFRMYAILKEKTKGDIVIKPGEYTFNYNMSYDQILSMLKTGDIDSSEVRLTFIEVLSLEEIADILEENKVCSASEFLEYLQTSNSFGTYKFFNNIKDDLETENLYMRMEGYVFPDTYQFYVNEKVSSVANKFLRNFDIRMTDERMDRMKEVKLDLHQLITLASIIQKEAGDSTEMRKVSSVFHNRLDNQGAFPNLQSDVTIFYVENHIKGKEYSFTPPETQELYDAYNTYKCVGLPVGPICNPGEDAIMAALYPAETNFNYFVTDVHGEYYYATNLAQHNENIALARQQDESGKGEIGGGILTLDDADIQK